MDRTTHAPEKPRPLSGFRYDPSSKHQMTPLRGLVNPHACMMQPADALSPKASRRFPGMWDVFFFLFFSLSFLLSKTTLGRLPQGERLSAGLAGELQLVPQPRQWTAHEGSSFVQAEVRKTGLVTGRGRPFRAGSVFFAWLSFGPCCVPTQ